METPGFPALPQIPMLEDWSEYELRTAIGQHDRPYLRGMDVDLKRMSVEVEARQFRAYVQMCRQLRLKTRVQPSAHRPNDPNRS